MQMAENVKEWFAGRLAANPELQAEYDRLAPRFNAIRELIRVRVELGYTQSELARRMGVKQPVVAKFESGSDNVKLDTLARAAAALGHRLEVAFKPLGDPLPDDRPAEPARTRQPRRTLVAANRRQ